MQQLISVPEAAEIIGVHRVTVWDWVSNGKLTPAGYVGGGTRKRPVFTRDSIEAYAASYKAAHEAKAKVAA